METRRRIFVAGGFAVVAIAVALAVQPVRASDSTPAAGPASEPTQPAEVFRDEFTGPALGPHWAIERPDPTAFTLAEGALRVESREPGWIVDEEIANLFRLTEPLPSGDWTVTTKLAFRFGTGAENFFLVLWQDKDHWVGAQVRSVPNKYTGHQLMLGAVEGRDGRVGSNERPLVGIDCNVCDSAWLWRGFSQRLIDDEVVLLRIDKRAGRYAISGRLGGVQGTGWVELEPIRSSIETRGLALGLTQSRLPDVRQGAVPGGASLAAIDWIAISVPGDSAVVSDDRPAVAQSVPTR